MTIEPDSIATRVKRHRNWTEPFLIMFSVSWSSFIQSCFPPLAIRAVGKIAAVVCTVNTAVVEH